MENARLIRAALKMSFQSLLAYVRIVRQMPNLVTKRDAHPISMV